MSINKENKNSSHILNASSNLVGFSFILFTTIRAIGLSKDTLLDEIAALEILLFCISSLFSFMSMRTNSEQRANFYENVADFIFFIGLGILCIVAILLTLTVIK